MEKVYIRNLKETITPEDIKELVNIVDPTSEIIFRITWDGEYLDCILYDDIFIPQEGSIRIMNNKSFLRQFSADDFCELMREATEFIVFEGKRPIDSVPEGLFDVVKILLFKDYEGMCRDLEKAGIVSIESSINTLSVSKKRFRFRKVHDQVKYGTDCYELDSLGGSVMRHISEAIESRWIQLKGADEKD